MVLKELYSALRLQWLKIGLDFVIRIQLRISTPGTAC